MALGLPSVTVAFNEAGATAIQRGDRGVVALILKDSTNAGLITMNSIDDMPSTLSIQPGSNKQSMDRQC